MSRAEFFTLKEAAVRSRLSERTLRRAIVARQLDAIYPGGRRRLLIPEAALFDFMYQTTALDSVPVDPEIVSKS